MVVINGPSRKRGSQNKEKIGAHRSGLLAIDVSIGF